MKAINLDMAAVELCKSVLAVSKLYSYRREYAVLNEDLLNTTTETAAVLGEIAHTKGDLRRSYIYDSIKGLNKIRILINVFVSEGLFASSKAMPLSDFVENIIATVKLQLREPVKKAPVAAKLPKALPPTPVVIADDDGLEDDYLG